MLRWMTALAFLVAPVWAQEELPEAPENVPEDEVVPEEETVGEKDIGEEPAWLPPGRVARGERDAPAVSVRLREGGILQAKVGNEWKETNLNDLSELLKTSAVDYDCEMQKSGKSGYDAVGTMKLSRLFVSIEAEPTVPWQHIQWLMTIGAEQKYPKFELSDGTRKLLAFLPVDRGIQAEGAAAPVEVKLSVHVICRAEAPATWGDVRVPRPTDIRYKVGLHEETAELTAVDDYVRTGWATLKDTPDAKVCGEIKAGHKAPFARVLDVMDTFVAAGLTDVSFYGTAIPDADLRRSPKLPYPVKNYDTPD